MFNLYDPLTSDARASLGAYDDLTASLLTRRGVTTKEEAEAFLSPSYDAHLGNPLEIKDMKKAGDRIVQAIEKREKIAVWSDYDCDGIPGGVVLHDFFKKIGADFVNYIPHRHEEGFGVNEKGLDTLKASGVSLVITVDCGISDISAIAYANSIGLEVIITDHHLPVTEANKAGEMIQILPPAYAVVDPKQEGEMYAFKEFCGGGLAWKMVCALLALGFPGRENIKEGWEKWLLDMAGLSTIADMVPLTGENRVIAKYGLLVMRKSPRIGFQKLCKVARVNQRYVTEDDVGFMIAPRVNAASRMGDAMDAFKLFTTEDENVADDLSKKLEAINRSRRAAGAAVTKKVHERLEEQLAAHGELPKVIAMGDPEWRPGLLGLVANNIAEQYQRPVFLWGREGSTTLKGSCRAGRPDVHLLQLMQAAGDTFIQFGGHRASGGFSVRDDAIFFLEKNLNAAFESLSFIQAENEDQADAEILPEQASTTFLKQLEKMAPFGMGNPKPVFMLRDLIVDEVIWFGKAGEHLKLRFAQSSLSFATNKLEAIAFFARRDFGNTCDTLELKTSVTLLASLERDTFTRGQPVRLRMIAIK
jgi:single-stranded-DNA-specific exonuclease